jgi:hypothetical protein
MHNLMITGSREMPYEQEVRNALSLWWGEQEDDNIALIHGNCPDPAGYGISKLRSVDQVGANFALAAKWKLLPVNAEWDKCDDSCYHGRRVDSRGRNYCPAAGPRRNKKMVDMLDPERDTVIAFPYGKSAGTRGAIKLAEKAGFTVITYELG